MEEIELAHFSHFIFRSPLLSWNRVENLLKANSIDKTVSNIRELCGCVKVQQAILVASQELYHPMIDWLRGKPVKNEKKLILSIFKYLIRMGTRCTPFGLFSGVGSGDFSNNTAICLDKDLIFVDFDIDYIWKIKNLLLLDKKIINNINWYINSTIYKVGNSYKYISVENNKIDNHYNLSKVERTDYLDVIINKAEFGVKKKELMAFLLNYGASKSDANEYIQKLIDQNIIVSELEPRLNQGFYFHNLYKTIKEKSNLKNYHIIKDFQAQNNLLRKLNSNSILDKNIYQSLLSKSFITSNDIKAGLQINTIKLTSGAKLNIGLVNNIKSGLKVLSKLSKPINNPILEEFKLKFSEKYEYMEVPLLEALDPEIGIDYSRDNFNDSTPLLDNINFDTNRTGRKFNWEISDTYLLKKLLTAISLNSQTIEIHDYEIRDFPNSLKQTPDTFSVLFSLKEIEHNGVNKEYVNIIGASGSSATNIISRFTPLDYNLKHAAKKIIDWETKLNSQKIIAELLYFSDVGRINNVLEHSFKRQYFIPLGCGYEKDNNNIIYLKDLLISLKNNSFIIRSKSLNKEIEIKSSNVYNYNHSNNPIYRFLCDLQFQDMNFPLIFDWGPLSKDYGFLPRVIYKNLILSPATWNIEIKKIPFLNKKPINKHELLSFAKKTKLPNKFLIGRNDNKILIDLDNELSVELFCDILLKDNDITITEFLSPSSSCVLDQKKNTYSNEIAISFFKEDINFNQKSLKINSNNLEIQKFIPGTKWLYYKIYAGTKNTEAFLLRDISKLIIILNQRKLIQKWFFVRYFDPHYHVKIRFKVSDSNYGEIIDLISKTATAHIEKRTLEKIVIDTYIPETSRYGASTISLAESIFYYDSEACLNILNLVKDEINFEEFRWQSIFLSIDYLLNDFGLCLAEKYEVIKGMNERWETFEIRDGLSIKYREIKKTISDILSQKNHCPILKKIVEYLENRSILNKLALNNNINQFENKITFITSCIHMSVNRICLARPNDHEILVYEFLTRYYLSQIKLHSNYTK